MLKLILGIPNRKGISTMLRFRVGSHLEFECRLVLPTCSSDGSISMVELSWEPNRTSSKNQSCFLLRNLATQTCSSLSCMIHKFSRLLFQKMIKFAHIHGNRLFVAETWDRFEFTISQLRGSPVDEYCCTWWFCWGNPAAKLLKNIPKYSQSFNPSGAGFLHFFWMEKPTRLLR